MAGPTAVPWVMERLGLHPGEAPPEPPASAQPARSVGAPGIEPGPGPAAATGPEAALAQEALALYQAGRVAEACERYRDLARRTGRIEARRDLGVCLARLGRDAGQAGLPQIAIEHFERAVREYPEAPELWLALGAAHAQAQDLSQAESVLAQGVGQHPADPDLLYHLAEVQERRGRTREAVGALRRLTDAHPQHARARTLLASLERDQRTEAGYWSQESRHFLVRYEGGGSLDVGRSVADALEEARESIGRDLGVLPVDRIQVGIYASDVFGDLTGAPPHLVAGVYDQRRIRLNLAASRAHSRRLTELVRHEYAHAVIHQGSRGQAPLWLHEGLAQVLEPRAAPRALRARVPAELLTLGGIERLSRTGNPQALAAGYALTHVAVEHLVERGGLARVRDLLTRLGQGEAVEPALHAAFGFGPDELERRLRTVAAQE
jgi:tetratricopeptide (TPR) repeat protein